VGATSSDSPQSVAVQNEGNAPLYFSSLATGTTSFPVSGTGSCNTGTALAQSGICTVAASFTPQQGGALADTFILTDNSLNVNGNMQAVSLSGTGTGGSKTISFTQPASPVALGSSATLVATASNGDPVTFSVTAGTGTASLSGNVITYKTVGTVTINANSAATGTYNAAPTVSYTVTITSVPYVYIAGSGDVASFNAYGNVSSRAVVGGGTPPPVDTNGYVWSINGNGTSVSTFTPAGALGSTYSPAGLTGARALAIDGGSNVAIANGNGAVAVVSNTGVAASTTQGSMTAAASGVAIDNSGNIWVTNPTSSTIDEIIGGAIPASPLANAVQNTTLGVKP
jgi:hypothetical protein